MDVRYPLLIVADLHLSAASDPELVRDFCRLLDRPAATLVINGDLFDLDWLADSAGRVEKPASPLKRVERLLGRLPDVRQALVGWLHRGGVIIWLPGNHDPELASPDIQEWFREQLAASTDNLRFESDGFVLDGVVFEHGHQRDPDNRFPVDLATAVRLDRPSTRPLGCLLTRFLLCRLPQYRNQTEDNHKTPLMVLVRVVRDYGWAVPRMVALYVLAAFRISFQAYRARRLGHAPSDPESSMINPWRAARRLYLDRILATLMLVPALVWSLFHPLGWWFCLPIALYVLMPPLARRKDYRYRDREGCRRAAAATISRGARAVVMGHTHQPVLADLAGGWYLNTGAFFEQTRKGRSYAEIDRDEVPRLCFLPPTSTVQS